MNDYRYHYMFTTFVSIYKYRRGHGAPSIEIFIAFLNVFFFLSLLKPFSLVRLHGWCCVCAFCVTEKDIEAFDLEDFKYNGVNITAFRLVDIGSKRVNEVIDQMQKFQHSGRNILNSSTLVQVRLHIHSFYTFTKKKTFFFHNISTRIFYTYNAC